MVGDTLDEPVLLVKCAWGGKSLAVDFRPPGAGKLPYSLGEKGDADLAARPEQVGKYYRETVSRVKEALAKVAELVPGSEGQPSWRGLAGTRGGTTGSATGSMPSMKRTCRTSSATCGVTWGPLVCRL